MMETIGAALNGHRELVELLLTHKANISTTDEVAMAILFYPVNIYTFHMPHFFVL